MRASIQSGKFTIRVRSEVPPRHRHQHLLAMGISECAFRSCSVPPFIFSAVLVCNNRETSNSSDDHQNCNKDLQKVWPPWPIELSII